MNGKRNNPKCGWWMAFSGLRCMLEEEQQHGQCVVFSRRVECLEAEKAAKGGGWRILVVFVFENKNEESVASLVCWNGACHLFCLVSETDH